MADGTPPPFSNDANPSGVPANEPAPRSSATDPAQKLPISLEAEQAVLGAILYDNEIFFRVSAYLKPDHFYDPVHQLIYDACGQLINSSRLASPLVIDTFLQDEAGFQETGGRKYLEQLAGSFPSVASAGDYARIVFDMSVCRGLIRIGTTMADRARQSTIDDQPSEQLDAAEQELYRLAETGKFGGGFVSFRSAITEAINLADAAVKRDGKMAGVGSGLIDLDKKLGGLHPSDLIILAARPSMGKTALAANIGINAARAHKTERQEDGTMKTVNGAVVGFFSLEMAAEQIATRIISEFSRVPSERIRRGDVDHEEFGRIYDAARELEGLPFYIDDTGGISIAQVAARARRLKRQHGLDMLIIDYLQLLTGTGKRNDNRVQEITEISMGLKTLAKELNIPVVALSQLSRQVESREDKRPQLSDLRESGSIEQDADVVMFLFREEYYHSRAMPGDENSPEFQIWQDRNRDLQNVAELIIGKQRHGPIGTVKLHFESEFTKFSNLAKQDLDEYGNPSYEG